MSIQCLCICYYSTLPTSSNVTTTLLSVTGASTSSNSTTTFSATSSSSGSTPPSGTPDRISTLPPNYPACVSTNCEDAFGPCLSDGGWWTDIPGNPPMPPQATGTPMRPNSIVYTTITADYPRSPYYGSGLFGVDALTGTFIIIGVVLMFVATVVVVGVLLYTHHQRKRRLDALIAMSKPANVPVIVSASGFAASGSPGVVNTASTVTQQVVQQPLPQQFVVVTANVRPPPVPSSSA